MTFCGTNRTYLYYVPSGLPETPVPLVFALHGGGSDADDMVNGVTEGRWNALADLNKFIVVYPNAYNGHWNDGRANSVNEPSTQNDVGFLDALRGRFSADYRIDSNRVYACGFSNGGMMSFRLAMELSDKIAAVFSCCGSMPAQNEAFGPIRPVPTMYLAGTADPWVDFDGDGEVLSATNTVQYWRRFLGVDGSCVVSNYPNTVPGDSNTVARYTYGNGEEGSEVVYYEVKGGGHGWPTSTQFSPELILLYGRRNQDIVACDEAWAFFRRHSLHGEWSAASGGTGSDEGHDLVTASDGSVGLVGQFSGAVDFDPGTGVVSRTSAGGTDGFVSRFDSRGRLLWVVRIGGAGDDSVNAVTVDGETNLLVTGHFSGSVDFDPSAGTCLLDAATGQNIFLAKYSATGGLAWAIQVGDPELSQAETNLLESGTDVAVDLLGNVFLTGFFGGSLDLNPLPAVTNLFLSVTNLAGQRTRDVFMASYDEAGVYRHGFSFGGAGADEGRAIAGDLLGYCALAGVFEQSLNADPASQAAPLSSAGATDTFLAAYLVSNCVWAISIGSNGVDEVAYRAMAVDDDHAVIGGRFEGTVNFGSRLSVSLQTSAGGSDAFVAQYGTGGTLGWARRFGSTGNDGCRGVAFSTNGSVFLTGSFRGVVDFDPGSGTVQLRVGGQGEGSDIFLTKLDPAGAYRWATSFAADAGSASHLNEGRALSVDRYDSLWITGLFHDRLNVTRDGSACTLASGGSSDVALLRVARWQVNEDRNILAPVHGGVLNSFTTQRSYSWGWAGSLIDQVTSGVNGDNWHWMSTNNPAASPTFVFSSFRGQPFRVKSVTLHNFRQTLTNQRYSKSFQIWGAEDGCTFVAITNGTLPASTGATTLSFSERTLRALKLVILDCWNPNTVNYWNLAEFQATGRTGAPDLDGDGMDDDWELRYFRATTRDGRGDADADGIRDGDEYEASTVPTNRFTDADGYNDYVESINGSVPTNAADYLAKPYRVWSRIWGTAGAETAAGVATDAQGRWYAAGTTALPFGGQSVVGGGDLCLTAYSAAGSQVWVRIWGSSSAEESCGVAVHTTNVYVLGRTSGAFGGQTLSGGSDVCVTCITTNGVQKWVSIWGSPSNESPAGVTVGPDGNLYVVGATWGPLGGQNPTGRVDAFLTKVNPAGSQLWSRVWGSTNDDWATCVTVDPATNVYVGGETTGKFGGCTNTGLQDVFVTRFNSAGVLAWSRVWGSTNVDALAGLVSPATSGVYVAGSTRGRYDAQTPVGGEDLFVSRLNALGTSQWSRVWGSAQDDACAGVAWDSAGDLYVAATTEAGFDSQAVAGGADLVISKVNSGSGTRAWSRIWGSVDEEGAHGLAFDGQGRLAVVGQTTGAFDQEYRNGDEDLCLSVWSVADPQWPAWWAERGVRVATQAQDYAVANAGQLKWTAQKAGAALDARYGAGSTARAMVNGFVNSTNYVPVNVGQVKHAAQQFHNRLSTVGRPFPSPWIGSPTNDYAPATAGQLKNAFRFTVDD
jgi:poly(3-hydroxybutyrate) depolymerase